MHREAESERDKGEFNATRKIVVEGLAVFRDKDWHGKIGILTHLNKDSESRFMVSYYSIHIDPTNRNNPLS